MAGQFLGQKLGKTRMVVEMALRQRDVDVARLTDRFAIVERLEHGKEAAVFLQEAGKGIEVPCALVAGQFRPGRKGPFGRGNGGVDVFGAALADLGERFACGRVISGKGFGRFGELTPDEMAEFGTAFGDPGARSASLSGAGP